MARLFIDQTIKTLEGYGVTDPDIEQKVRSAIAANLPSKTYNMAVVFLGLVTLVLALGSIGLAGLGRSVPEALWGALGAGIGGLAGIFMAKD
jgi:hypothetical protein